MTEEISLDQSAEKKTSEGEPKLLENLEEKIGQLLARYQDLVKERDELISVLEAEREKRVKMEKEMDLLSQDREKVKVRIDQLLHHLKGIDL